MLLNPLLFLSLVPPTTPEAPEPPQAPVSDASSDPDLEVPGLDNEVLPGAEDKTLDSLNPPPKPPKKPAAQTKAPAKKKAETPPAAQPEFRYASEPEQTNAFRWSDGKHEPDTLQFASDAQTQSAPLEFAKQPSDTIAQGDFGSPQSRQGLRRAYRKTGPSRQRFGLNLKIGPYLPEIDKGDPNGPYAKVFGEVDLNNQVSKAPTRELIYWLGFEWQFYNLAGPLSVGLDLGFFTDSQSARVAQQPGQISPADKNRFSFVPMALLAGYRFSYLADKTPIPLVPYLRGGLSYNFWWAQRGSGQLVRDPQGKKVRGGMLGWQGQVGLALRLDGIFRRAGRRMDHRFGINHVSLFGELSMAKSGLGGKKINVGDKTFYGGLLLEF